jgi:hypothetical protein
MLEKYTRTSKVGRRGPSVVSVQSRFSFTPPHELQHKQEVLGRINSILSFDTTGAA